MPADFLSHSKLEEVSTINPFTPSLILEQAQQDPEMIALHQFHKSSSWPVGTSKSDEARIIPLFKHFLLGTAWSGLG